MAASPYRIRLDPQDDYGNSIPVLVAITNSAGSTPTAYTDDAQTSTQSIGWINSATDYYFAAPDTYTVSVKWYGQEIAQQGCSTASVTLNQTGVVYSVAPKPSNLVGAWPVFNEGSASTPYWTPVHIGTGPIWGVETDWRDQVGYAVANNDAEAVVAGSGIRIFGDGLEQTDSGAVAQTAGEGGITMRLSTTNQTAHLIAIGMDAGVMQPDQHGPLTVDVEMTNVSAITARAMYVGFVGTAIDAFVEPVTGDTVTATLVQDDLAGIFFDTDLTDADRWYGVHNKSNASATQDLSSDGDTSTNVPAAGTYQRLRVEIAPGGGMTAYADKSVIYTQDEALDTDEECSPIFYLAAQADAVKTCDVRRFSAWAVRAT